MLWPTIANVFAPAASATAIKFGPDGTATILGTSGHRADKQSFSFTAAADGRLAVSVARDATGLYAQLEIEDTTSSRSILELRPRGSAGNSGAVTLVKGHNYIVQLRSQNMDAVAFVVNLSLTS